MGTDRAHPVADPRRGSDARGRCSRSGSSATRSPVSGRSPSASTSGFGGSSSRPGSSPPTTSPADPPASSRSRRSRVDRLRDGTAEAGGNVYDKYATANPSSAGSVAGFMSNSTSWSREPAPVRHTRSAAARASWRSGWPGRALGTRHGRVPAGARRRAAAPRCRPRDRLRGDAGRGARSGAPRRRAGRLLRGLEHLDDPDRALEVLARSLGRG